jgi:hypothetical protein
VHGRGREALIIHHAKRRDFVISGLPGCSDTDRQYLMNGTIFGKMLLNRKHVFLISLQLLFETFLILRKI